MKRSDARKGEAMQSADELEALKKRVAKLESLVDELTVDLTTQAGHNLTNSLAITKLAKKLGMMPEEITN
jgi:archaellum component FlaC